MKIYLYDHYGLFIGVSEAKPCAVVEGEFLIPAYATDLEPPAYNKETEIVVFESSMPGNGDSKILECSWHVYPKQVLIFDDVIGRGRPMTSEELNTYKNNQLIESLGEKGYKIVGIIQEVKEAIGGCLYLCDITKQVFSPYMKNSGEIIQGEWTLPNSDWFPVTISEVK